MLMMGGPQLAYGFIDFIFLRRRIHFVADVHLIKAIDCFIIHSRLSVWYRFKMFSLSVQNLVLSNECGAICQDLNEGAGML